PRRRRWPRGVAGPRRRRAWTPRASSAYWWLGAGRVRMAEIVVEGGRRLEGEVLVSGSKNAALPLLFSTLLTPERCVLRNVPALADIRTALAVLRHLGARVAVSPD